MVISKREKVLRIFFDNPTKKFHVREIARNLRLNPNTILNVINNLEKEKLIIKKKKPHIVEVYANLTEDFKILKRLNNLKRIYESKILDFLKKEFSPGGISVVGSYSLGEDIEESDIDIVVISNTKKEMRLSKFERLLKRKIHLIVIKDYNSMSEEFYINLINGIVLYGYVDKR